MKQNWFKYDNSLMRKIEKEIRAGARRQREEAAEHLKDKIKKKALAMKKSGNLAKGVYTHSLNNSSMVGIRAPGFHNFLIEFGHFAGSAKTTVQRVLMRGKSGKRRWHKIKGEEKRKFVAARPIVYPTFDEEANTVANILGTRWLK